MTRLRALALAPALLLLAACGAAPAESTSPAADPVKPAVPSTTAALAEPAESSELPHGHALHQKTCLSMLEYFDALEPLSGKLDRAGRVEALKTFEADMTGSAEWRQFSVTDQQAMLTGLADAEDGTC